MEPTSKSGTEMALPVRSLSPRPFQDQTSSDNSKQQKDGNGDEHQTFTECGSV